MIHNGSVLIFVSWAFSLAMISGMLLVKEKFIINRPNGNAFFVFCTCGPWNQEYWPSVRRLDSDHGLFSKKKCIFHLEHLRNMYDGSMFVCIISLLSENKLASIFCSLDVLRLRISMNG